MRPASTSSSVPAAVRAIQIDQLDQGLGGLAGYRRALVALRDGRAVVGLAWLPVVDGEVSAAELRARRPALEQSSRRRATEATPPISVVVCTRDRPAELRACLASLLALDYPDYEVVVVDNASAGAETAEVVARSGFRYAREERPGLDWARNRGLAEARHPIIAYTDDDVQADAGWLRGIAAGFADPHVSAVTGLVLPAELETEAQAFFERYSGMSKGLSPRLLERERLGAAGVLAAHQCGVGANMAFRRQALEALGGFDTALDVGTPAFGGGDIDIFHRALAAGMRLRYEPSALVWHRHRRDMAGLRRQIYSNGRAFGVYLRKIWRDRTVPRRATGEYAARWLGGWLLRRLVERVRGRLDLPFSVVWAELWGACHALPAFRATYRSDARIRAAGSQAAAPPVEVSS